MAFSESRWRRLSELVCASVGERPWASPSMGAGRTGEGLLGPGKGSSSAALGADHRGAGRMGRDQRHSSMCHRGTSRRRPCVWGRGPRRPGWAVGEGSRPERGSSWCGRSGSRPRGTRPTAQGDGGDHREAKKRAKGPQRGAAEELPGAGRPVGHLGHHKDA